MSRSVSNQAHPVLASAARQTPRGGVSGRLSGNHLCGTCGGGLREAKDKLDSASPEVTEIRSPYGLVTLWMRSGALISLTANPDAVSRAGEGQLEHALWEAFDDAGLTSSRDSAAPSSRARRPRAEEPDPEEDLWKGLGQQ